MIVSRTVKSLTETDLAHTRFGGCWHTDKHRVTKVRIDGGALVYLVPCRLWVPHACATSKTALPLESQSERVANR